MDAEQRATPRSTGWSLAFILLGFANLFTVALPIAGFASIERATRQGDAGAGYGAIILWPLALIGVGVLMTNVVLIAVYVRHRQPRTSRRIIGYSVMAASVVMLLGAGYIFIDSARDSREQMARWAERHAAPAKTVEFTDITAAEAERLLRNCDLRGFYYTRQSRPALGAGGELSPTGVVLTTIEEDPHRISIADRLIDRLVPVAEEAQDDCGRGRPQIWHHGHYQ